MKKLKKLSVLAVTAVMSLSCAMPMCASAGYQWQTDENGKTFCYDDDGNALTGTQIINDNVYFFASNGAMKTGWRTADDKRMFFDNVTGEAVYGWLEYCNSNYFITQDGGKMTGFFMEDNDSPHLMDEKGTEITDGGFHESDGKTFYIDADGNFAKGKSEINDDIYIFGDGYSLLKNDIAEIDGSLYFTDGDGKAYTGWQEINGYTRYFSEGGELMKGWQTIDGDEYYFGDDGTLKTNTVVDGKVLGADGKVQPLSEVQVKANAIISNIGTSTEAIYNYVRNNNKYSFMEQTRSQAQIEAIGWSYFANYALNNRFVVCYYFAAVTDLLLKQAGWESRIVHGTGRGTGEHYWNELNVNGTWYSIDTCNGYYMVFFSYLQTQNYTFYNYVYPTYN